MCRRQTWAPALIPSTQWITWPDRQRLTFPVHISETPLHLLDNFIAPIPDRRPHILATFAIFLAECGRLGVIPCDPVSQRGRVIDLSPDTHEPCVPDTSAIDARVKMMELS